MERQWVLREIQHKTYGSNDNRVAEKARFSWKGSIILSFKCEPSNRLLKFVACLSATGSLRCKPLFAQKPYFPQSASYKNNIVTSLPSLKGRTSESFPISSLDIPLIYSLHSTSLQYCVYMYLFTAAPFSAPPPAPKPLPLISRQAAPSFPNPGQSFTAKRLGGASSSKSHKRCFHFILIEKVHKEGGFL